MTVSLNSQYGRYDIPYIVRYKDTLFQFSNVQRFLNTACTQIIISISLKPQFFVNFVQLLDLMTHDTYPQFWFILQLFFLIQFSFTCITVKYCNNTSYITCTFNFK